jgi:hypothetical protein
MPLHSPPRLTRADRRASAICVLPGQAGGSKRPFATPQRLSASGPPLRDHGSRPAPSPLYGVRHNPVRFRVLPPRFRRAPPPKRCCTALSYSPRFLASRSPWGPSSPAGSSLAAILRSKTCLHETPAVRPSPARTGKHPPPRIAGSVSLRSAWLASSVNLLEPPSSCTGTGRRVNRKDAGLRFFPQLFGAYRSANCRSPAWESCE